MNLCRRSNFEKIDIIYSKYYVDILMLESCELNESTKDLNMSYSEAQFYANLCSCLFRKLTLL